jgi:4-amino-4-deoxy-L-arabinose transferase-like glycosyltransferase
LISLLWGLPLLVLVAATWYVPMYMRNGWQFINEFIIQQHFQRFTTNKYQHPQPFYFFFWVLPLMTIPWLPFFLAAIPKTAITLIQTIRRSTTSPSPRLPVSSSPLVLGASWLLVPLLFFSFSGSKLPGYILPAVPGAVLLTSVYIFRFIQKSTLRQRLVQAVAVGTYFVMVCAVIFAVPRFVRRESVNELIDSADSHGYASAPVLSFMTISHNAEFYAAGRLARDPDGKQHRFIGAHEVREYIDQHGGVPVVVLVPRDQIGHLSSSDLLETQVLNDNGDLDVAIVRWK